MNPHKPPANGLGRGMIIAAWLLVMALLTLFFQEKLDDQQNPNRALMATRDGSGRPHVTLKRNRAGHYLTPGLVNGHPVTFLLDTGATDVAIPINMARQLGLSPGTPRRYRTANGLVTAYETRIETLEIGPIVIQDVNASLNPGMGNMDILLGMSLLKRLEFTQKANTLTLTPMTRY